MIAMPEHTILISPTGDPDIGLLKQVGREIRRVFGYESETRPLLESLNFSFDPGRSQYHSTPILEKLASLTPATSIKVFAITDVDLFIPILTHVYGEAQLGGKACIVSIHRLKEGLPPLQRIRAFRQRVAKEAIHELGHTFGLRHCKEHSCIMHYCRSVRDVDEKSDQLCRYCKIMLEDELGRLRKRCVSLSQPSCGMPP